jgi:hypothetical protein
MGYMYMLLESNMARKKTDDQKSRKPNGIQSRL